MNSWVIVLLSLFSSSAAGPPDGWAEATVKRIGLDRGICVLLGDAGGERAVALARKSDLLVYLQLSRPEEVRAARRAADAAGLCGTRIYVARGPSSRLHLADNVADAVVVTGGSVTTPETELLRVVRPQGKILAGSRELTRPAPPGGDDWSHPYHGPDNNPQSRDTIARAPYLTQFLADPRYGPVPQVAVSAGGRVFKAFGHIAFKAREEPLLNTLVAFNGYNGTVLWKRELAPGIMVHRNTMVATPEVLYVADDESCKVIDAASGRLRDEIRPPAEVAGGTFWKWLALEGGKLYALTGEQEHRDPVVRWKRRQHGWPWNKVSPGFNQTQGDQGKQPPYTAHPWGFGRTLLAMDPRSKEVLWHHREVEPIDSRAVCMKGGRIFVYRHGSYLACLDAGSGRQLWRRAPEGAPDLFAAIGPYLNRQGASWNWRTTAYLKCSEDALYFAGPQVGKLVAVSARDGYLLWQNDYGNFQLLLRDDGLYAISGQNDIGARTLKLDPLTGRVLAAMDFGRRACTRPTGAADAIFFRARGGSTRLDLASQRAQWISPMRPPCHDGVTIANGLLYWWPSVCDCNLTLYGVTCLGPAGDFEFGEPADGAEPLERAASIAAPAAAALASPGDWPAFRANNRGTVATAAVVPPRAEELWRFVPSSRATPTAPTAVGDLVFSSGADGAVRALDAATGALRWQAHTGGPVRIPPTIWKGRAFVGSGDGRVYAFEAGSGRLLWRFRAAPVERRIPVYGALLSTWPAASGVLVADGVAYVAAGIVNYDGTYVYALDATTGEIRWQNATSGHLDPVDRTGVSVQGHLLLADGRLYLAGGNAISPAAYDTADGKCLNDPGLLRKMSNNNVFTAQCPRGWELYRIGSRVLAAGPPFYAHPHYPVYDRTVSQTMLVAPGGDRDIVWANKARVLCYDRVEDRREERFLAAWGKLAVPGLEPLWEHACEGSTALAVCSNAVVVATGKAVTALSLEEGEVLWTLALPAPPVPWGLAVNRAGRTVVALEDGRVLCFGRRG
jgi:outer membrane protein assembly factor BamB